MHLKKKNSRRSQLEARRKILLRSVSARAKNGLVYTETQSHRKIKSLLAITQIK